MYRYFDVYKNSCILQYVTSVGILSELHSQETFGDNILFSYFPTKEGRLVPIGVFGVNVVLEDPEGQTT
jgi:hypothetical protein